MTIESINEPGTSRTVTLTPMSLNEPLTLEPLRLDNIDPDEAAIGDPDLVLHVHGAGFLPIAQITFNGGLEPTTFVSDTELTTGVKPSTATTPGTYPVTVVQGEIATEPQGFTFTEAGAETEAVDPDDLEEEIDAAREEGDFKPMHRGKPLPSKRKR